MAKDITIKNPQGTVTYYPKTVSQLVYDNDTSKTISDELKEGTSLSNTITVSGNNFSNIINVDLKQGTYLYAESTSSAYQRMVLRCRKKGTSTFTNLAEGISYFFRNSLVLADDIDRVEVLSTTNVSIDGSTVTLKIKYGITELAETSKRDIDDFVTPSITDRLNFDYELDANSEYQKIPTIKADNYVKISALEFDVDNVSSVHIFAKTVYNGSYVDLGTINATKYITLLPSADINYLSAKQNGAVINSCVLKIEVTNREYYDTVNNVTNILPIIEYIPKTEYSTDDLTLEHYYNLSGANAPTTPTQHASWACQKISVHTGDTVIIEAAGGNNARAYALTDTSRVILTVAAANESTIGIPKSIVVQQDGYLYTNTSTQTINIYKLTVYSNNQEDEPTDEPTFDVHKLFNPPINLRKSNLKILDIGNSYTNNALQYIKSILNSLNIDYSPETADFSLYKAFRGSGSFDSWYQCYNDNDTVKYTVARAAGKTINDIESIEVPVVDGKTDGTTFRDILKIDWDLIIIHQVSDYSDDYTLWETYNTVSGNLKNFIRILKKECMTASIGFLLPHSYRSTYNKNTQHSSLLRWEAIAESVKFMISEYGIDFVIPYGTAVQNLRASSLNDEYEFSTDGTHLAEGIGCYVASCTYYQSLFAVKYNKNIFGSTWRRTNFDETVEGVKNINDANALLAQKAAFFACYDWFTINNPDNYNI